MSNDLFLKDIAPGRADQAFEFTLAPADRGMLEIKDLPLYSILYNFNPKSGVMVCCNEPAEGPTGSNIPTVNFSELVPTFRTYKQGDKIFFHNVGKDPVYVHVYVFRKLL